MGQISSKVVDLPDAFEGLRRSGTSAHSEGPNDPAHIAHLDNSDTESSCSATCGDLESSPSNIALSEGISQIRGEVARQSRNLHQLTGTTYETFLSSIQELNGIAEHFLDSNGKQSDHRIVLMKPINEINNQSARHTRVIKSRPITQSGIDKMRSWLMDENWKNVYEAETSHLKAEHFQNTLMDKFNIFFPEKTIRYNSDDAPWMTQKLKKLDRRRKRIYRVERKSEKWKSLNAEFK